ncbi:MAG: M55 family metallopeptidase [Phycisphaeraceae bacterium]
MKIYILADMEGISGIRKVEEVALGQNHVPSEYAYGRKLMMDEINQAVAGCFDGGATEVVACDTHGGGGQVQLGDMDERAVYETPVNGNPMPALDSSFAGLILIGHHAMAGTADAFLEHTMSGPTIHHWKMNGQSIGEIAIEAGYAGHFNVPLIMVSGDAAVCAEAKAFFGDIETACVKWGISRHRARCLAAKAGCKLVRQACRRAVERAGQGAFAPYRPATPLTMEIEFQRNDYADATANNPAFERTGGRTIRWTAHDLRQMRIA